MLSNAADCCAICREVKEPCPFNHARPGGYLFIARLLGVGLLLKNQRSPAASNNAASWPENANPYSIRYKSVFVRRINASSVTAGEAMKPLARVFSASFLNSRLAAITVALP